MNSHLFPTVFFYPHANLRDRQLDTVRQWPLDKVINPEVAQSHPHHYQPLAKKRKRLSLPNWKKFFPLINIKLRPPRAVPMNVPIYCWGGFIANGPYIIELDNPYCMTGYNVFAYNLYKPILAALLLDRRCTQIRCISAACKETLHITLGEKVAQKAIISYPYVKHGLSEVVMRNDGMTRLLYISTHYYLKAGAALVRSFKQALHHNPNLRLTLITYLPETERAEIEDCPQITIIPANLPRETILKSIMPQHDILVHSTFAESFGMVIREALSQGLAVISTDVYAIPEMVEDGKNGTILHAPISTWDGKLPNHYFTHSHALHMATKNFQNSEFESRLCEAIVELASDPTRLLAMKMHSLALHHGKFGNSTTSQTA